MQAAVLLYIQPLQLYSSIHPTGRLLGLIVRSGRMLTNQDQHTATALA
jgi:hypothetical protein